MQTPQTQFAYLGGDRIVYQVVGEGSIDLVVTNGSFSNIDMIWEDAAAAQVLRRFASFSRLILFDRRGAGGSDPLPLDAPPNWESWMDDLRAVMDAAGSERAAILGAIDGNYLAIPFAATYPERTVALVLINGTAKYVVDDDYPEGSPREAAEQLVNLVVDNWGTEQLAAMTYADRANDERFVRWYAKYLRASSSPRSARTFTYQLLSADIRPLLPLIQAPTLVMHRTGYMFVPIEQGRYMASRIPGARFVELSGRGNVFFLNPDELADQVEEFLTGVRRGPEPDRALATVLFTDIVRSTDRAAELGDRRWRDVLDAHDATVRGHLDRFRGRLINTTGDGMLATFDSPGRAIRFAMELQERLSEIGLEIRTGLHTGEIELRDAGDIGGIAVHIAARIMNEAGPREVLVSRTVKDLVAGSTFTFEDRGIRLLKGIPDDWQLFALS